MDQIVRAKEISLGGGRTLIFTGRCLVMGILNCTPDSFYPDSRKNAHKEAVAEAIAMIQCGVDIIDIGGESTRPGSEFVDVEEECRRTIPVIAAIRQESTVPISIDTRKAAVAEEALNAGADIMNDVSSFRDAPDLGILAAERGVPVVLMHMRGTPKTMQDDPRYEDTISEVEIELTERAENALSIGVAQEKIILDPGIGFSKRLIDNLLLIKYIERFHRLGFPLLLGISRKSFIDKLLHKPVEERLAATLAAEAFAVLQGVEIIRVHDVGETMDMVKMLSAIQTA